MMDTSKVGYTISYSELISNYDFYKQEGMNVFQIFLGSPMNRTYPDIRLLESFLAKNPDVQLVVHGPFWISLASDPHAKPYSYSLRYLVEQSKILHDLGIKHYVTHIGSRGDTEMKYAIKYLRDFCLTWLYRTEGQNTVLCLENDSGSKNNTKMGFLRVLETVVKNINSPRIKLCLDTEHAYANGVIVNDVERLRELEPYLGVVHYNSIPSNVIAGGHLDRHSTTLLEECKEGPDYLRGVYNVCYNGDRPFILERSDYSFAKKDVEFMKGL